MNCIKPQIIWNNKKHVVSCGKCLACLSNKRRDWIFRLTQEHKASKGALFITLTYHSKYCPDELSKKHLQLFMKRLRKREIGNRIRYYAVGEYGSKTGRPHYHILLFNCDLSGETIRKSWKFGIVHIGQVTEASIAYCTKYVIQPTSESTKKSFSLMSRGYGIGLSYLTDSMAEWHRNNDRNYTMVNGIKNRLPRFYKEKIWPRITAKDEWLQTVVKYQHPNRDRVNHKSKWDAIKLQRKELRAYVKKYGIKNAKRKMTERRDAVINRIRVKVAFTQTI